ncbi:MAG: histidine phosphatase family protein [Chloroflexota bacterium]|nr:histidine phosphatase family protein [Chloroflexota bacterium]
MSTPPVERIDLTGRRFDSFHHPDGKTTELILVRHGQTEANINGLLVGRQDVLLTDLGHHQAQAVADEVKRLVPDALVTSPLQRARQTAAPIGAATGLLPKVIEEIAEFSFGDLEGFAEHEAITAHPHLRSLIQGAAHPDDFWPGGESANSFVTRILLGLTKIMTDHHHRRVVVVTHGGVIGTLGAILVASGDMSFFPYLVRNCTISSLTVTAAGTRCDAWNQTSHLGTVESTS